MLITFVPDHAPVSEWGVWVLVGDENGGLE